MRKNPYKPTSSPLLAPLPPASSERSGTARFLLWPAGAIIGYVTSWIAINYPVQLGAPFPHPPRPYFFSGITLVVVFGAIQAAVWILLTLAQIKRTWVGRLSSGYLCMVLVMVSLEWGVGLLITYGIDKGAGIPALAMLSVIASITFEICLVSRICGFDSAQESPITEQT